MLLPAPPLFPRKRKPHKLRPSKSSPTPPVDLVLVSATYVQGTSVTLTFDRAIDIAGFDGSFVLVRDGAEALMFDATGGAELLSPAVMRMTLVPVEGDSSVGVTMNVSPENGIVAVDDGGTWGGVSELSLPWP